MVKNIRAGLALPFSKMADGRQNSCSADDRSRREMSARRETHPSLHLFLPSITRRRHPSIHQPINPLASVFYSFCLSLCPSLYHFFCPSVSLSVRLFALPFFIGISVAYFIISACPFRFIVHLSLCICVFVNLCLSLVRTHSSSPSIHPSIHTSIHPSIL